MKHKESSQELKQSNGTTGIFQGVMFEFLFQYWFLGFALCPCVIYFDAQIGLRLMGKVAVITGAGGAIGRTCATMLAAAGAKVGLCDLQEAAGNAVLSCKRPHDIVFQGKETVSQIEAMGGEASFHTVDVSDENSVREWIDQVAKRFGNIHILVNKYLFSLYRLRLHFTWQLQIHSAAAFVFGTIEETTSADWDRVLAVNVKVCSWFLLDGPLRGSDYRTP